MKETEIREEWMRGRREDTWRDLDPDENSAIADWWLALRAKELGEIAEKIKHLQCLLPDEAQKELNIDFESYDDYCTGQMMAKSQALRIVDELIEKPAR